MLQLIDISATILYDKEKMHNQLLEMINACVSHEMRNPLNSIIAMNIEKKELYKQLQKATEELKLKAETSRERDFLKKFDEIKAQLDYGQKIQQSSSNVLAFIIQDLLDFA